MFGFGYMHRIGVHRDYGFGIGERIERDNHRPQPTMTQICAMNPHSKGLFRSSSDAEKTTSSPNFTATPSTSSKRCLTVLSIESSMTRQLSRWPIIRRKFLLRTLSRPQTIWQSVPLHWRPIRQRHGRRRRSRNSQTDENGWL